jgi:hypothetical protein
MRAANFLSKLLAVISKSPPMKYNKHDALEPTSVTRCFLGTQQDTICPNKKLRQRINIRE